MTKKSLSTFVAALVVLVISGMVYLGVQISSVQHTIQVAQKQQSHTRVLALGQLCDLTGLLYAGALQQQLPSVAVYKRSLDVCLNRLAWVKRADAAIPDVR